MGYGGILNRESVEKGAVVANYPVADGYSINKGDVVDVVNGEVVVNTQPNPINTFQASNSEVNINVSLGLTKNSGIVAWAQNGTGYVKAITENGLSNTFAIDNSENMKTLSIVRLSNNRVAFAYVGSGTLRVKIGTIYGSGPASNYGFSYGIKKTAINSNLTEGVIVALSENKLFAISNRNGIDTRVCNIVDNSITDDDSTKHGTVSGVSNSSKISASLLPNDDNGNKRVIIYFLVDNGDIKQGKAVIATIDISDNISFGEVLSVIDHNSQETDCSYSSGSIIFVTKRASAQCEVVIGKLLENGTIQLGTASRLSSTNSGTHKIVPTESGFACVYWYDDTKGIADLYDIKDLTANKVFNYTFSNTIYKITYGVGISASNADDNKIFISFMDSSKNKYLVVSSLEIKNNMIAGSFTYTSTQAIALNSGTSGQNIDIVYSGPVEYEAPIGTKIESKGVKGYVPVENVLDVIPWYATGGQ